MSERLFKIAKSKALSYVRYQIFKTKYIYFKRYTIDESSPITSILALRDTMLTH